MLRPPPGCWMPRRSRRALFPIAATAAALFGGAGGTVADLPSGHVSGPVLDRIRHAASLSCGALTPPADYTRDDTHGVVLAFDEQICKAVAVAILGEAAKVQVRGYPDEKHGLTAVHTGEVDLLVGASPLITSQRRYDVAFAPAVFMDGQSYMVSRASGITKVADLNGQQICFISETESEFAMESVLPHRGIRYLPFPQQEDGEMQAALVTGHCTAMAGSITQLAVARSGFKSKRNDFVILADPITLDPIAPAYAADDPQLGQIVTWTTAMLLQAEQSGITQHSAAAPQPTEDPDARALNGTDPTIALALGLRRDWALDVIRAVGNYAELFERTLGLPSPLHLARGYNALWSSGGVMYPPPLR